LYQGDFNFIFITINLSSRKVVMEHQATVAKFGAHMGLGHQVLPL
jgi:hypothetical protein